MRTINLICRIMPNASALIQESEGKLHVRYKFMYGPTRMSGDLPLEWHPVHKGWYATAGRTEFNLRPWENPTGVVAKIICGDQDEELDLIARDSADAGVLDSLFREVRQREGLQPLISTCAAI